MRTWRHFFTYFELPDIGNIYFYSSQSGKGPSEAYLVHLLAQRKASLSQVLNIFDDKNTAASLNYPCQCLNTLTVKKSFLLISSN